MLVFRGIFLLFMMWMLVIFLPSHTRGRITMGPKSSGGSCCEPAAAAPSTAPADDCCGSKQVGASSKPSAKDRANCAVCFWAAGLLASIPVVFDHSFAERAFEQARHYDAQVKREAIRLTHHGRDPPATFA